MRSLAERSARDAYIIEGIVNGKGPVQITRELNASGYPITHSRVSQIKSRPDIVLMIKECYERLASVVPDATDRIIKAAGQFSTDQAGDDKKISWEANKLIAQAHGLLPAASQSIVHQTYIQNQTTNVIPPVIDALLTKHFGGMIGEVIDGEEAIAEESGSGRYNGPEGSPEASSEGEIA